MTTSSDNPQIVPWLSEASAPKRPCGSCSLCCRLVPVQEEALIKPSNTHCPYQGFPTGCRIYARRPISCQGWSCLWVFHDEMPAELQPSVSHVVFDSLTIAAWEDEERSRTHRMLQMWVDPQHPEAWDTPLVRQVIAEMAAKTGMAMIVRRTQRDSFVLLAPCLNKGRWRVIPAQFT